MLSNDLPCPEFSNSPMVETVLGVQFEPIRGFRSNHYGWFWHNYLNEVGYKHVSDESPLPTYVEAFGVPRLNITKQGEVKDSYTVRMKARSENRDRTVQLQSDKLYLSWNRSDSQAPRYASVKNEFSSLFDNLNEFASNASLGSVRPNLWEIQYVNQIPPGELWQEPKDWHHVLPTLFPAIDPSIPGVRFATYSGEWHFEIEPQKGRVHVRAAKMVMNNATQPTLYFSLLARGEIGSKGSPDLVTGMETGHAACIRLFLALTSPKAQTQWGLQS